jgi:hypothetical protein
LSLNLKKRKILDPTYRWELNNASPAIQESMVIEEYSASEQLELGKLLRRL